MPDTPLTAERKQAILTLLDDPSPAVRTAVLKEVRKYADAGVLMLREVVETGTPEQVEIAEQWLESLGGENHTEHFFDYIQAYEYELESGSLMLERTIFPRVDAREYFAFMHEVSGRCRELLLSPASGYEICKVINRVLFHEYGFRGDNEHYYNPLNSYLNQVISRRRGLPITLSILYILVADRCGLQLEPISLPGHFVVGCFADDEPFYIDTFVGGAIRTHDDIEEFLYQNHVQPRSEHFQPATTGEVLCRCCRNLANQYAREGDEKRASYFLGFVKAFEEAHRKHA